MRSVVRAIEIPHAACQDELRRNPRSHSRRLWFCKIYIQMEQWRQQYIARVKNKSNRVLVYTAVRISLPWRHVILYPTLRRATFQGNELYKFLLENKSESEFDQNNLLLLWSTWKTKNKIKIGRCQAGNRCVRYWSSSFVLRSYILWATAGTKSIAVVNLRRRVRKANSKWWDKDNNSSIAQQKQYSCSNSIRSRGARGGTCFSFLFGLYTLNFRPKACVFFMWAMRGWTTSQ